MSDNRFASCSFLACAILLVLLCVFTRSNESEREAEERAEQYASGIERAEDLADRTGQGLAGVAEQIRSAGSEIEDSLTEVGEIGIVGDRIAGTDREFKVGVEGLEGRIRRCLEILEEGEEKEGILADCCGCGCGGCRCRGACSWP